MPQLETIHKRFIVKRTACFVKNRTIRDEFEKEFRFPISEEQISAYDAGTKAGQRNMGEDLKAYFAEVRADFLDEENSIAVSHRAVRLRMLEELLDTKIAQKVPKVRQGILEQIAKECGGMYEQRQTGGKPADVAAYTRELMLKVRAVVEEVLPDEETRQPILEAIQGCLAEIDPQ